jgi:integrase
MAKLTIRRIDQQDTCCLTVSNVDRKHVRRPLSADEFAKLLRAAERGPELQRIGGRDRAMLYLLAAYTGYRRNEIGSLTVQSFDFESKPPTLTVAADRCGAMAEGLRQAGPGVAGKPAQAGSG